ncbi:MAG TPA: IS110 family transposase [Micavibrio sp.]|jgi:transposase
MSETISNTNVPTPVHAGIDVAARWLDVVLDPVGCHRRFDNDEAGVAALQAWLNEYAVALIAMEATGGLERLAASQLMKAGYKVAVLNPARISGFRQALGKIAKTDLLDAAAIALFAKTMPVTPRPPAGDHIRALKDLSVRRSQLTRMMVAERNRAKRMTDQATLESISRVQQIFKAEQKIVDRAMKALVEAHDDLKHRFDILISIPGIGVQTALCLLADMPELGLLADNKIAALAGVAPMNRDSGKTANRASLRGGRKMVRTNLYMATLSAIRFNPPIKAFNERLILKNGRPKMVALAASMRKLLLIANHLLAKQEKWSLKT